MVAASALAVASPLALAGCGNASSGDSRSAEDDPELLNEVLAQHLAATAAIGPLDETEEPAGLEREALRKARTASIEQLESFITEADGEVSAEPAERVQAESAVEALARQLESSIEASLAVVGELSAPAHRQAVHRYITEDAATLAALRAVLGEDVAADAFVFGAAAPTEGSG